MLKSPIGFRPTRRRRDGSRLDNSEFNPLLHLILPIGGIVLFFFPLYYQFYNVPPPYPFKYANWVAIAYTAVGVVLTLLVVRFAPQRLSDLDHVYLDDETDTAGVPTA